MSREAVSLSEDVDDHTLVWDFKHQALLGDVAVRILTERYLPHMVGSAWPLSLQASSNPQQAAVVVAVFLQRPLGMTKIVPLDLARLAAPLEHLRQMALPAGEDRLLQAHCGYSSAGTMLSPRGFARLLRR